MTTHETRGAWWRLVKFGFRLLYNEFAFTYDLVSKAVSFGAWRCWQRASLKPLAGTSDLILELAHGTGDLQIDLAASGYRAVGYDLSPHMGRIAGHKLRRLRVAARLARGRAQALPFPGAHFPVVISTFPSEFIVAPETLREVYRVLRPGGMFVIVPGAAFTGGGVLRRVLEWLYRVTGQELPEAHDPMPELARTFTPYGFAVEVQQVSCPRSVAVVIVARKFEADAKRD